MQVFINDKSFECAPGTTLHEVLAANAIPTGNIAIAGRMKEKIKVER